jgi:nucleotide-binding universal stress UspA family protein
MNKEFPMINPTATGTATATTAQTPSTKDWFFKNILVATDFSPASDQAIEYAASLARRYGSAIYVTHVITLDGYPLVSPEYAAMTMKKKNADVQTHFRQVLKSGKLTGIPFKTVVKEGNLWPTIEESIKIFDIDLVIVGTHGAGAVEKMLIGSSAEEIFRKAKVPVLTIGPVTAKEPWYEMEFKNILFATDFGKGVEREAEYAFSLAQEHRSRLTLLHVFPHPEAYGKEALIEMEHNFYAQLRELVPVATEMHCKVEVRVVFGEPTEQILRIAEETKAQLIVMGAKARKSLAGNVPHTKAYRVVCGAQCPVMTIRS